MEAEANGIIIKKNTLGFHSCGWIHVKKCIFQILNGNQWIVVNQMKRREEKNALQYQNEKTKKNRSKKPIFPINNVKFLSKLYVYSALPIVIRCHRRRAQKRVVFLFFGRKREKVMLKSGNDEAHKNRFLRNLYAFSFCRFPF